MVKKYKVLFMNKNYKKTNFKKDDLYIIEKVLKTSNDKAYVKWRNYDSSFNSWVKKIRYKKIFMKKPCH